MRVYLALVSVIGGWLIGMGTLYYSGCSAVLFIMCGVLFITTGLFDLLRTSSKGKATSQGRRREKRHRD